jgi:hypothetical protein
LLKAHQRQSSSQLLQPHVKWTGCVDFSTTGIFSTFPYYFI